MAGMEGREDFQYRVRIRRKGASLNRTFEFRAAAEGGALRMDEKAAERELSNDRKAGETIGETMAPCFRYRIYDLTLTAPRPLPLMREEPDPGRRSDVVLRFDTVSVPAQAPVGRARRFAIYADGSGLHQSIKGARILVREGKEIVADLPENLSEAEFHALLCGPPLGWLMYQRARPPLHACVVRLGDAAIALAGDSGAGKSTLARALIARGHRLVTDDQAVIDPATHIVHPGYPAMKLWAHCAQQAGDVIRPALRVRDDIDKYYVPMVEQFCAEPLPLAAVVVLASTTQQPRVEDTRAQEASALLLRHLYRRKIGLSAQAGRIAFEWSMAIARSVPLFQVYRSSDMAELPALARQIETLAQESVGRRA